MAASDIERFRQRLAAAGASIPEEIVEMVALLAGPMITSQEELAALDLGDAEPFCPSRRLVDDAT
jgi:hypothetical protein